MDALPRVQGAWLKAPETQGVLTMLAEAGHRALAVGGCVRNALIGVPVADVDVATDARPERVTALAEAAGLQAIPTGIEHGTVTVVANGVPHEVTTFRRDVETDGRHAVVAFSDRVEEDAARRDFTMNALYAERDGRVVDPLGSGLADLAARRLRFVGEAEARIREDHLRILRFFRFHAWYGDPERGLDPEGLAACARLASGVDRLSAERVGAEMKRLLAAPDPSASLAAMEDAGVLARVAPGADPAAVAPLVALEGEREPSWIRRLLAVGADDVSERWRLSRAEARRLEALREALARGTPAEVAAYRHDAEAGLDLALVRMALHASGRSDRTQFDRGLGEATEQGSTSQEVGWVPGGMGFERHFHERGAGRGLTVSRDLDRALAQAAKARFPLRAADLMPERQGPALGAALKRAETAWIASGFALDRDTLRRIALEG